MREAGSWVRAIYVGVLAGISSVAILTSTSGELEPLVAWDFANIWQIPGLIVVGVLVGIAVTDLRRGTAAYLLNVAVSASLHILLLAMPGLDSDNYTVSRFNNGFTTSIFVLVFVGVFGLVGQAIAIAFNIFVRGIFDS